jgi:hypothetical protein
MTKTAVYRHFSAGGNLLYVGCSHDPIGRYCNHKSVSAWAFDVANITLQWFDTRQEALDAEQAAIIAERPLFNCPWVEGKKPRWSINYGQIALHDWSKKFRVSIPDFADRLGISVAQAKRLFNTSRHIHIPMQIKVCIATDGYVALADWDRLACRRAYGDVPRLTLRGSDAARANLKDALHRASRMGIKKIPYADMIFSNTDAA